jgi:hypothetical protein
MDVVNKDMGVLPFAILAIVFVFFSGNIAYIVVDGKNMSLTFTAITVWYLNVLFLVIVYQIISMASKSRNIMCRCWDMAEECVTESLTEMENKVFHEERKALIFYLTTRRVVCAKACDIIVIDGSLVLSFFSELIPFTVMLFTTLKQFIRLDVDKHS